MTETMGEDTRYGYDDLDAGDLVEVTRASGDGMQVDKIVGTVSAQHRFGEQPKINSAFGPFYAQRETDMFRLLKRKDPVQDVVDVWTSPTPGAEQRETIGRIAAAWPALLAALDALVRSRA